MLTKSSLFLKYGPHTFLPVADDDVDDDVDADFDCCDPVLPEHRWSICFCFCKAIKPFRFDSSDLYDVGWLLLLLLQLLAYFSP